MHHNPLRRCANIQDELLTRQAARSLRAFVEQAWPVLEPTTPFLPNWHIDLVCEHLEAITAGQTTRLLINLPPRYIEVPPRVRVLARVGVDRVPQSTLDLCELQRRALAEVVPRPSHTGAVGVVPGPVGPHRATLLRSECQRRVPEYPPGRHVCHLGRRLRDGQRRRSDHRGRSAQLPTGGQRRTTRGRLAVLPRDAVHTARHPENRGDRGRDAAATRG